MGQTAANVDAKQRESVGGWGRVAGWLPKGNDDWQLAEIVLQVLGPEMTELIPTGLNKLMLQISQIVHHFGQPMNITISKFCHLEHEQVPPVIVSARTCTDMLEVGTELRQKAKKIIIIISKNLVENFPIMRVIATRLFNYIKWIFAIFYIMRGGISFITECGMCNQRQRGDRGYSKDG